MAINASNNTQTDYYAVIGMC